MIKVAKNKNLKKVKAEIPRQLHMALIKIQAEEDLDYDDACIRASILLDMNSEEHKKSVKKEAERIHKKRFFKEVGKTHATWREKGRQEGYEEGRNAGYTDGMNQHKITYPCNVCGKPITMYPGSNDHEAMKQFMKQAGWSHAECLKK